MDHASTASVIPLREDVDDPLVAYLLVRTDLPSLGRGKAYAHAMHAGNQLTHDLWVTPLLNEEEVDQRVIAWHEQGRGFGTTLAVGDEGQVTKQKLKQLTNAAKACGHLADIVIDDSYPYHLDDETLGLIDPKHHSLPPQKTLNGWRCYRQEITAGWVLGHKSELTILLSQFGLVPND